MGATLDTLMVVESHGSGIIWTEPRDLDGEVMSFLINTGQTGELNGHGSQVNAVFGDGAVRNLPITTPSEDIRGMATIGGGEIVTVP